MSCMLYLSIGNYIYRKLVGNPCVKKINLKILLVIQYCKIFAQNSLCTHVNNQIKKTTYWEICNPESVNTSESEYYCG